MSAELRVFTLVKDGEKYIFRFDDRSQRQLLGVFGRFAANPELNFSWHDAAVASKKLREICPAAGNFGDVTLLKRSR